jgi:hypothetical protein
VKPSFNVLRINTSTSSISTAVSPSSAVYGQLGVFDRKTVNRKLLTCVQGLVKGGYMHHLVIVNENLTRITVIGKCVCGMW